METNSIIVSMIVVVRNAEHHIQRTIESLINQGFKKDQYEIIVSDGMSDDSTLEKAKNILDERKVNYKIILNEKKLLASGWNLAIRSANGRYVIRPDAHSELLENYIKNGIKKLDSDSCLAAVGGVLVTSSSTFIGKMISKVLSSPIGVGNSLFRVGVGRDTYSDTAVFAVYQKKVFSQCGYFNESLKRNQDIDMHKRMIDKGYKFLTSPSMQAKYYSRTSVLKFANQGFLNGFWVTNSNAYHLRHLAPLFFIIILTMSAGFLDLIFFISLLCLYAVTVEISFIKRGIFNFFNLQVLLLLTFLLHTSYGIGSILGLLNKTIKNV